MLDQETGLRGFALTGREEFLDPHRQGLTEFERARSDAYADPGRNRADDALLVAP